MELLHGMYIATVIKQPVAFIAGGLFDALEDAGGDIFKVTNDVLHHWQSIFLELEGIDIQVCKDIIHFHVESCRPEEAAYSPLPSFADAGGPM